MMFFIGGGGVYPNFKECVFKSFNILNNIFESFQILPSQLTDQTCIVEFCRCNHVSTNPEVAYLSCITGLPALVGPLEWNTLY